MYIYTFTPVYEKFFISEKKKKSSTKKRNEGSKEPKTPVSV